MKLNRYEIIFFVGLIVWITETWAFGWHAHPQSSAETILDDISGGLMLLGVFGISIIAAVKIALKELGFVK